MIARILITPRSKLDQAILASVAAMLALNLFVLAGQFQPEHLFAQGTAASEGMQA
jgi:hypothetical protein